MTAAPRTRARRVVLVVAIAVVLIVAGGVGSYLLVECKSGSLPSSMTTGLEALALVESALSKVTGQSWTPFADLGISSSVPFTPWALGGNNSLAAMLATIRACGGFPFPTVWNVSDLPYRSGNLTDGFAPFWQFLLENESAPGQFVFAVGVYDAGRIEVTAALPATDSCVVVLGLAASASAFSLARPNLDTNLGSPLAYRALSGFDLGLGPYDVIWTNGWSFIANSGWGSFLGTYGNAWGVTYYACGQAGVTPSSSLPSSWHMEVWSQNGTATAGGVISIRFNCTLPSYDIASMPVGVAARGSGFATTITLNISYPVMPLESDAVQGLAAWMTRPVVENLSTGSPVAEGTNICPVWTSDPGSCDPPSSGYYALLLSPSGSWLDSYGVQTDGLPGWSAPNVPLLTNDSLVLLSPNSPGASGENFQFVSDVSEPTITSAVIPI